MKLDYRGPIIDINFDANEVPSGSIRVQLADGYTYERIFIHYAVNITEIAPYMMIRPGECVTFPVVNSKSPSIVAIHIPDPSKSANIRFSIEKFGQIPDPRYFDNSFEPILVTGDDGNEYNVIPSDQFK